MGMAGGCVGAAASAGFRHRAPGSAGASVSAGVGAAFARGVREAHRSISSRTYLAKAGLSPTSAQTSSRRFQSCDLAVFHLRQHDHRHLNLELRRQRLGGGLLVVEDLPDDFSAGSTARRSRSGPSPWPAIRSTGRSGIACCCGSSRRPGRRRPFRHRRQRPATPAIRPACGSPGVPRRCWPIAAPAARPPASRASGRSARPASPKTSEIRQTATAFFSSMPILLLLRVHSRANCGQPALAQTNHLGHRLFGGGRLALFHAQIAQPKVFELR